MNIPIYKEVSFELFQGLKKRLETAKKMPVKVTGSSMHPLLDKNQDHLIMLSYLENISVLKRFDVVTFWQGDKLITHYFWRINKNFNKDGEEILITRPLNPIRSYDIPIKGQQILGRADSCKIGFWLICKILMLGLVFRKSR